MICVFGRADSVHVSKKNIFDIQASAGMSLLVLVLHSGLMRHSQIISGTKLIAHKYLLNEAGGSRIGMYISVYTDTPRGHTDTSLPSMLEQKPLAYVVSPTVLQSGGIRFFLTSAAFSPVTPSKLG